MCECNTPLPALSVLRSIPRPDPFLAMADLAFVSMGWHPYPIGTGTQGK